MVLVIYRILENCGKSNLSIKLNTPSHPHEAGREGAIFVFVCAVEVRSHENLAEVKRLFLL